MEKEKHIRITQILYFVFACLSQAFFVSEILGELTLKAQLPFMVFVQSVFSFVICMTSQEFAVMHMNRKDENVQYRISKRTLGVSLMGNFTLSAIMILFLDSISYLIWCGAGFIVINLLVTSMMSQYPRKKKIFHVNTLDSDLLP